MLLSSKYHAIDYEVIKVKCPVCLQITCISYYNELCTIISAIHNLLAALCPDRLISSIMLPHQAM